MNENSFKYTISCRDCGTEFNPDNLLHKKRGFYDQCKDCADDVEMYLGSRDGEKHGSIVIHRGNLETVKAILKSEVKGGFYPKINLGNPAFKSKG